LALLYALASYPEAQSKAQAEIDLVVGMDRLPSVTDRQDLPYVQAIVKEVGRWFTVVPLGEFQGILVILSFMLIMILRNIPLQL
jgi:cytochrome P450